MIGAADTRRAALGHRPRPQRRAAGAAHGQRGSSPRCALRAGVALMPTVTLNGESPALPDGATVADAVEAAGAPADGRGVAVAVDGEVVPRADVGRRRPLAEGARGRGAARGSGRMSPCRAEIADRTFASRLILGTGGFRSLEAMAAAVARVGRRDGHRGDAPRGPRGARLAARGARGRRLLGAAEHRRLLHRARRRDHRPAGARGAGDRLGEARGDRRRQDAAARRAPSCSRPPRRWWPTASPCSPTPTTTRCWRGGWRTPAAPR